MNILNETAQRRISVCAYLGGSGNGEIKLTEICPVHPEGKFSDRD